MPQSYQLTLYLHTDPIPDDTANLIYHAECDLLASTADILSKYVKFKVTPEAYPYNLVFWNTLRSNNKTSYLVAYQADVPLGFLKISWDGIATHTYPNFKPLGYPYYLFVDMCYVRSDVRRSGIASALLTEVAHIAQTKHYAGVCLSVQADNQGALACYRHLGYNVLETQWYGTPQHGLSNPKDLTLLSSDAALKSKLLSKLIHHKIQHDSKYWPILMQYEQRITDNIYTQLDKLKLPVLLFANGHLGASVMSTTTGHRVLSGFPTILTQESTMPTVFRNCWKPLRTAGHHLFGVDMLHYSTLSSVDLHTIGLNAVYYVLTRSV